MPAGYVIAQLKITNPKNYKRSYRRREKSCLGKYKTLSR